MSERISRNRLVEILLVEDNPGDVRLTQEALRSERPWNRMSVARDGVEAMAYLRGQVSGAVRPDLILLDLNLPKKDGREVLSELKSDPKLKLIPVVVLTTSKSSTDIRTAYELHANSYVTKPADLIEFMKEMKSLEEFWFSTARLPSE